ncbi:MAG TPA: DUF4908 domain-containing protein [Rhizomicrobium sp.]|nr:DUF4908 domain-containing protein [Rhizomicrobium sp.]
MKLRRITFALALAGLFAPAAEAQQSLNARLEAGALGNVEAGTYAAGDNVTFTLLPWNGKFLLQIAGDPETYVLTSDQGSLGGRVLKYDSGATAIHISGWGGMTLYTDDNPSGLPAVRTGDLPPEPQTKLKLRDVEKAADDATQHLANLRRLKLSFSADWNKLATMPGLWFGMTQAMGNAGRGIERFTGSHRAMLAMRRFDTVQVGAGAGPAVTLAGRTILITFNTDNGPAGLASSRAIAHALGSALSIPPVPTVRPGE